MNLFLCVSLNDAGLQEINGMQISTVCFHHWFERYDILPCFRGTDKFERYVIVRKSLRN